MERKIIALNKGIHRNPTVGADGELADCVNLMVKNGEIVNAGVKKETGSMQDEAQTLLYIHHSTTGKEWRIALEKYEADDSTEHWRVTAYRNETALFYTLANIDDDDSVKDVTSIGNILIISTNKNIYYNILKENGYVTLGNHIPELELNFGLDTKIANEFLPNEWSKYFTIFNNVTKSNDSTDEVLIDGSGADLLENISAFTTAVKALVTSFHDDAKKHNKFASPFLVRYALKLYDGTYTMPSAPILMIPTSGLNPVIRWERLTSFRDAIPYFATSTLHVKGFADNIAKFTNWKDIVKGVGVFVSAPFIKYDQSNENWCNDKALQTNGVPAVGFTPMNDKWDRFYEFDPRHQYGIGKDENYEVFCMHKNIMQGGDQVTENTFRYLPVPYKKAEQIESDIRECAEFYKIKDYTFDEIPTLMTEMKMKEKVLETLTSMERLEDDSLSRFTVQPSVMQVFNGRLHIGNITKIQSDGFDPASMISFTDGYVNSSSEGEARTKSMSIDVYLNKNSTISKISSKTCQVAYDHEKHPKYIYYPDSDAYMCCITYESEGTTSKQWFKMKAHSFLGGALALSNILNAYYAIYPDGTAVDQSTVTGDGREVLQNKIYSSEVYNPFKLDETQAKTVGEGEVLAMTSNVKALSQGQFGQYPMIAFTSEGIWSMDVDSEGKYSSSRPLLRDVIIRDTKPLQTDDSIFYMTKRGVMMLLGSEAKCVSKALDGHMENVPAAEGLSDTDYTAMKYNKGKTFTELMNSDTKMLYDYENGVVRLYSSGDDCDLSHIYDLETGEWTRSTDKKPKAIVAGYPVSIAQYGGKLYEYKLSSDDSEKKKGVLMTRETAFGDPLTRKSLMDLRVQRKHVKNADSSTTAQVAVWASNDRQNWTQIKTLKGRSWIWYRFAVYTKMTDVDGIEGIVCDIATRNEAGRMR